MQHGVYDKRRNRAEADYIAQLVRELLRRECGRSIGIVAFSEAQQDEIEAALQRLAQDDAEFRDRLDAEWEREIDGQFVGLLVKNLENIQGDERDIIILSVCYGYGPNGKMLMNFGPINKSGGERRLNVAFSRAKHHMAIVSSIQFADITNDYNDGANCLKNYLRYAEAVSTGNREAAHRVLHGMSRWQAAIRRPGRRGPTTPWPSRSPRPWRPRGISSIAPWASRISAAIWQCVETGKRSTAWRSCWTTTAITTSPTCWNAI